MSLTCSRQARKFCRLGRRPAGNWAVKAGETLTSSRCHGKWTRMTTECCVACRRARYGLLCLEAYWSSLDSVSLSLQLDPTAQQYRLMVVVRHVEDIAWTPEESKTEEGLENFDPAENYQRTCEIRVGTSVLWSCRSSQPTNCLLLCAMSPSTLCSMWNTRSSLPSRYNT
jgi:hypothetical protein